MVSTDPEVKAREREEKRQNGGGLSQYIFGNRNPVFSPATYGANSGNIQLR